MQKRTKSLGAIGLAVLLLLIALTALVLLAVIGIGPNYVVLVTTLSVITALVAASIAACMSAVRSDTGRHRSQHQWAGVALVGGMLLVATAALVVLAINFGPAEVQKNALGGLIALAGIGITAVLTQLRTEAVRKEQHDRADRQDAKAEAAEAKVDELTREARGAWSGEGGGRTSGE